MALFKPYYGQCQECPAGTKNLVVINKPHLCQFHNRLRKGKQIISSIKAKPRKTTGEWKVFQEIWVERPHVSQVSGMPLGDEMKPIFFSHVLSKGAYPKFRLLKENIWLETPGEHMEWESKSREDPKWDEKKKVYERLKQQYHHE